MITDFFQGMIMLVVFLVVMFFFFDRFGWDEIMAGLRVALSAISDPVIRTQMTVPTFVSCVFPVGLMGFFAAVVIMMAVSTDSMYMHAWGTILVQDVVLPTRKRPFGTKRHLLVLRLGVLSVAVFAFFFSIARHGQTAPSRRG